MTKPAAHASFCPRRPKPVPPPILAEAFPYPQPGGRARWHSSTPSGSASTVTPTAPAAQNFTITKILELLAGINTAVNESGNIKRTCKVTILSNTREIEQLLSSNANVAHNTQADPAATTAAVRQAVREEVERLKPPEPPAGPATAKLLEEGLLTAIRNGIREELKNISAPLPRPPAKSYADTARASPPKMTTPTRSLPSIIIKSTSPSNTQTNVLDDWKAKVSFRDTTFAPAKVKPLNKNTIRVDFDKPEHCAEAKKRINAVPGMCAEDAKKRRPLVILKGISKDVAKEELIPILAYQNSVPAEDMRLCFALKNRNERLYNAVLEVAPAIRGKFVETERVNLEHQRVRVTDFSRFVQCFKCLQFGHTNNKCTAAYYPCSHCASTAHSLANCPHKNNPDMLKCINCTRLNAKTGNSASTKHSAVNNKLCPRIKHTIQLLQESTDYGQ
ncbi:hypothetical protein ABMA27_001154 [Loxostege sticticalis]|uniref:CCHC-type domain-containing protein n=1 Tax=Loxostege sticticalis TaxID=481309 RepID=A0ABR3I1N3_LOXSC